MALEVHGQSHLTNQICPYSSLQGAHNLVVSMFCHNFNSWIKNVSKVSIKSIYNCGSWSCNLHCMNSLLNCLLNRSIIMSLSCVDLQLRSLSISQSCPKASCMWRPSPSNYAWIWRNIRIITRDSQIALNMFMSSGNSVVQPSIVMTKPPNSNVIFVAWFVVKK
jgi:hypothetical protein